MTENDTVKMLKECDAGIKMGVSALNDVIDKVQNENFKALLTDSKNEHEKLHSKVKTLLLALNAEGKNPNAVAVGMKRIKTEMVTAFDKTDNEIASIITDGLNMGVKSLHRYLNQYKSAGEDIKNIAKKLINIEERLAIDIRVYL